MFEPGTTSEQKVSAAERLFGRTRGHYTDQYEEHSDCAKMLAGEQWDAVGAKVLEQDRPVSACDAQAEVIHVASFVSRLPGPGAGPVAVRRHQVDERCAGPELVQAD